MKNIVETAIQAGAFNTLVQAIKAADLVETLSIEGPFTVCAPTDEAFSKLPSGTIDSLLKDKESLKQVLLYHVASGQAMSRDIVKLKSVKTLQGEELKIDITHGVKVGDAQVTQPDIECSNGVIHVIDRVLIPKSVHMHAAPR
ncbi:fasciclin domain-containing protein [Methanosarcina sp. KYL-1]|uniref:fasciclin domain-containing protein n=1 Tax=Methanosarcina sp. KYL-1 TaxID=2602068 RepID=UPI002100F1C4|nr:fasciclin domain-containing protein [Methanosarcina sp. KYL-1]MCQ1536852.1 fasciclin domain-containing protein [Methanosarcina sp. KYL-1]